MAVAFKLFNRRIVLSEALSKAMELLGILGKMGRFRSPSKVFCAYLLQRPMESITLWNGTRFRLGASPLDVTTAIVVFNKEEYGSIPQGGIVVDVGANIGMFSVAAALGGAALVLAYEPNPTNFKLLCQNIKDNGLEGKILPFPLAVDRSSGGVLYISKDDSPLSHTRTEVTDKQHFEKVPTISLPDILEEHSLAKVNLLKMDCEGAEHAILPHLDEITMSKIMEIRMEIHPLSDGGDPYDSLSRLKVHGFVEKKRKDDMVWLEGDFEALP
jgi:FkbM family methyltransferase